MTWEFTVLDWIRANLTGPWGDRIWPLVSAPGNAGVVWICLAAVLLCVRRTRKVGACVAVALVLDVLSCNLILKPLVNRVRPCAVNAAVSLLIAPPGDASFPSGHTAASFAAVGALLWSRSRLWIPALVLACLIAFSRLYLYVHFPTDVLAGVVLGLSCGFFAVRLLRRIDRKKLPQ